MMTIVASIAGVGIVNTLAVRASHALHFASFVTGCSTV
jgi:hypothetical protein